MKQGLAPQHSAGLLPVQTFFQAGPHSHPAYMIHHIVVALLEVLPEDLSEVLFEEQPLGEAYPEAKRVEGLIQVQQVLHLLQALL